MGSKCICGVATPTVHLVKLFVTLFTLRCVHDPQLRKDHDEIYVVNSATALRSSNCSFESWDHHEPIMNQCKDHNLWHEALQTLTEGDRARYEGLWSKGSGYLTILDDIISATEKKKQECVKKRWKVSIRGRTFILSDILEKVTVWVNKFVAVGDNAVQYDPGHAALPWAAIRFILKASLNEVEVFWGDLASCRVRLADVDPVHRYGELVPLEVGALYSQIVCNLRLHQSLNIHQ
jgi:hypothetical protein